MFARKSVSSHGKPQCPSLILGTQVRRGSHPTLSQGERRTPNAFGAGEGKVLNEDSYPGNCQFPLPFDFYFLGCSAGLATGGAPAGGAPPGSSASAGTARISCSTKDSG